MARFTIGIPTYNRAAFLRQALASACNQLDGDVEIVVVNNGSIDSTREELLSVPANVRVLHNEQNQGASVAFAQALEAANTEFFSWLQDDDLLQTDFLRRALLSFSLFPEAAVFMNYAAVTSSRCNIDGAQLYGPPVGLHSFVGGQPRLLQPAALVGLSLLCSVATPPVMVFRRVSLELAMAKWDFRYPLYAERTLLNAVLAYGPAVVDGTLGAIYFKHPGQEWQRLWQHDDERRKDWSDMALKAQEQLRDLPDWQQQVEEMLSTLPLDLARTWSSQLEPWNLEVAECAFLYGKLQKIVGDAGIPPVPLTWRDSAKGCLRQLVPPLFWEGAATARRLWAARSEEVSAPVSN